MSDAPSLRSQVHRMPKRAEYRPEQIHAILDAGHVVHIGFVDPDGGFPVVIPTVYARLENEIVFHASRISRLAAACAVAPVCAEVTLIDGLVLAKSAFHHSMNYRSVIAFGRPREIVDAEEKDAALAAFVEKLLPGRYIHVRPPDRKELAATAVFALALDEASAKIRTGPPADDPEDLSLPVEAGVIPFTLVAGAFVRTE